MHLNFKNNLISDTAQKQTSTAQYKHKCFTDYVIPTDNLHEMYYLSF